MYVPGGIDSTVRMRTLAKLQYRRTHVVRPFDGKARIGISNEYMYNVMQCIVAWLYSPYLRSECDVHANSSGGITSTSFMLSYIHLVRVSADQMTGLSRLSIVQRYNGGLSLEVNRRMSKKSKRLATRLWVFHVFPHMSRCSSYSSLSLPVSMVHDDSNLQRGGGVTSKALHSRTTPGEEKT
jgi:hypothetical protein